MSANQYRHDFDNPLSHLNALEVSWLAADSTVALCIHCHVETRMLPMTGTAWALELFHESGCPEHEDNQPEP